MLDQLADDVVLEARLPKVPAPAPALIVTGKEAFVEGMAKLPGKLPRFVIVSALENNGTVSLVLEDEDRHLLVVGIDLDEDGLFSRITSFRPDR